MLVYYLSSHGFGHAVRSCALIRALPDLLPLTIRSGVPAWFLHQELPGRAFTLRPGVFDCGVLGPDSSAVDLGQTAAAAEQVLARNAQVFDEEVAWLKRAGARLVITDIAPFALAAARAAGIPGVLVANFTWPGIYQHLIEVCLADARTQARLQAVSEVMQAEYAQGDLLLETAFAIPMHACRERREVGLITRTGTNRRERLAERLGLDPAKCIYLLYLGRDGLEGMDWPRLSALQPTAEFVAYTVPAGAEAGVHELSSETLHHADAAASVDAVIAKPGYGICAECIAAGTPLLYPPRPHFAETAAIEQVLNAWGGALQIATAEFRALDWQPYLDRLKTLKPDSAVVDLNGAEHAAEVVQGLYGC